MSKYLGDIIISVCIQTYQHKKFIKKCIESVLMQKSEFSIEIIIGEDDSTDGTREICQEYENKFPEKIRLFLRSEKDRIYIEGKKTGRFNFLSNLKAAQGKYIALLDGDDYWTDEYKLQKQVDWMEKNPGVMISTHPLYWVKENGESHIPSFVDVAPANQIFTLEYLLENYFLWMSAIVFVRDCILDLPEWFWELYFIDYPLCIHVAQKGEIGFIKEAMGVYNVHSRGRWSSMKPPKNEILLWKHYTFLSQKNTGKVQDAMKKWRRDRGGWLIHFYRAHLWYNSTWLKKDLQEQKFPEDELLLQKLTARITWNNIKGNIRNILKMKKKKKAIS